MLRRVCVAAVRALHDVMETVERLKSDGGAGGGGATSLRGWSRDDVHSLLCLCAQLALEVCAQPWVCSF